MKPATMDGTCSVQVEKRHQGRLRLGKSQSGEQCPQAKEASMINIFLSHWATYLYLGWLLVIVAVNLWPRKKIFGRNPPENDPALRRVADQDQTLGPFRNRQGRVRLGNYHGDKHAAHTV
jgi:hypothetical protein